MMFLLARLFIAIPMAVFGLMHFLNAHQLAEIVPTLFPGGVIWVYITGIGLLAAALAIVTRVQLRLACMLLACMIGVFIITIHIPTYISGDSTVLMMLLKDLAITGGVLALIRG